MRAQLLSFALSAFLIGCGNPPSSTPDPAANTDPASEADHGVPDGARFGGTLVVLGEQSGELVVHQTGELHLHVPKELEHAGVTVTLSATDGVSHSVAMHWEDAVQGFCGQMEDTPAVGEAEVLLVHEGEQHRVNITLESLLPEAVHHGSIVAVGDHTVEVVVESDGSAHAYVLDDPDHRLDVELTLNLAGDDAQLHPLALHWDEDAHHFLGHIEGLRPAAGPLEVIASDSDHQELGHGTLLGVALAPPDALGGDVPADFRLEMPALGSNAPAVTPVPPEDAED